MKNIVIFLFLVSFSISSFSEGKRDILQNEAEQVNLSQTLIKDFSELNFPGYNDRNFWNNLPENLLTSDAFNIF